MVCVFSTAGPTIKLIAWGEGDSGGHVLRETTSRGLCGPVCPSHTSERGGGFSFGNRTHWCVFIIAVPNTKLFAWGWDPCTVYNIARVHSRLTPECSAANTCPTAKIQNKCKIIKRHSHTNTHTWHTPAKAPLARQGQRTYR